MTEPDDRSVFPAEATHISGRRFLAHLLDDVLVMVIFVAALVPILILEAVIGDGALATVITGVFAALAVLWLLVGHLAWFVWQESRMMSSGYRRRFGDRWGDTYVIAADTPMLKRG